MTNDLTKLAGAAKIEFQRWAEQEIKEKREAAGRAQEHFNVVRARVEKIYDEIIESKRRIMEAKSIMRWNADFIATMYQQIKEIESALGIVCPATKLQILQGALPDATDPNREMDV